MESGEKVIHWKICPDCGVSFVVQHMLQACKRCELEKENQTLKTTLQFYSVRWGGDLKGEVYERAGFAMNPVMETWVEYTDPPIELRKDGGNKARTLLAELESK